MATSLDELQIEITAKASSASQTIDELVSKLNKLAASLGSLNSNNIKSTNSNLSAVNNTANQFSTNINKATKSANESSKSFKGLAYYIGKFYATYFMAIRGLKQLWSSIESTADYIEAYNYFNVALGKIGSDWSYQFEKYGYENAESYAESFATRLSDSLSKLSGLTMEIGTDGQGILSESGMKNLGLNIQEITQYASQLASVTNAVGQTGEVSLAASSAFTKLAGDISSLFNLDYSSVAKNLQSGLIGQSRALYKYGIDITNATLQTYAYNLGIEKSVSEMTQAEKMQLRMLVILKDSKVAWGDLANTINSPSNMIRQLTNNLKEAGLVLGQLFIPLLQKVLPVINGVTIAIKRLLVNIAGLLDIEIDLDAFGQGYTDLEDNVDDLTDSYEDVAAAAEEWKNQLLGFDEVNKLSDTTDTATANGLQDTIDLTDEIIAATEEYEKVWNAAYEQMESKVQNFADKIEKYFKPIETLFEHIKIGDFFAIGEDISGFVTSIVTFISNVLDETPWDELGTRFGEFFGGSLIGSFNLLGESSGFISKAIIGINTFLSNAINSVDWHEATTVLLENIIKFLENLDIVKIIETATDVAVAINSAIISIIDAILDNPDKLFAIFSLLGIKMSELLVAVFDSTVEITAKAIGDILGTIITNGLDFLIESWGNGEKISGKIKTIFSDGLEALKNGEFKEWLGGEIGTLISDISSVGADIFLYFKPAIENFTGTFEELPEWFKNEWANDITAKIEGTMIFETAKQWFDTKMVPWINEVKRFLTEKPLQIWTKLYKSATQWRNETLLPWINNVSSFLINKPLGIITKLSTNATRFINDTIIPWFNQIKMYISTKVLSINVGISTTWNELKNTLSSLWKNAASWINNNIIKKINNLFKITIPRNNITSFLGISGYSGSIITLPSIPTYQTGGFPEDGLFYANHNELVGQFDNGKTAVANNGQIIDGIRQAAYEGMVMALSEYNSGSTNVNVTLEGDADNLFKVVQNKANNYTTQTGKPAFLI